ncbi:enoyl-CoA hydratase/isomerase family protein [Pseudonocardia alni]|uniref:enoyl-CoA hydratase/isomerase family protein n=1 Tax=Pseudonocardia alni TaxID=33907 RepID=UPI003331F34F
MPLQETVGAVGPIVSGRVRCESERELRGDDDLVQVHRREIDGASIVVLRLNRPEQLNPIDKDTIAALVAELDDLCSDVRQAPDAIIITGNGTAFSAGGDLKGYQSLYHDPARFRRFQDDFDAACAILERCRPLTVAMVNGACVAGGLELALACDLITMSRSAKIGDGHLRFAQLPGAGGSQRLVRAIGVQRAKRWLLTGDLFDADAAHDSGLTTLLADADDLEHQTLELAVRLSARTPLGRERMKELIGIAQVTPLDEGLRRESAIVHSYATTSFDAVEGLSAFADRRPARYRGE